MASNFLKKSVAISSATLIVSLISFLNQLVIANYFGASSHMDLFFYSSSVSIVISAVLVSGISYSFIPFLITIKKDYDTEYVIFLKLFIKKYVFTYSFLYIVLTFFNCLFIWNHKSNYYNITNQHIYIVIFSWISGLITNILAIFSSFFNVTGKFIYPVLINAINYIFTIVCVVTLHDSIGIVAISFGILFGNIIALLLSIWKLRTDQRSLEILSTNNNNSIHNEIKKYLLNLPIVSGSLLMFSIFQVSDSFWASKLYESDLSYLSYSQRLIVSLGTLLIMGPSALISVSFSESIFKGRTIEFLYKLVRVLKVLILISIFLVSIGISFSTEIISIIYERGAFTNAHTTSMSKLFPYMLIGMIFMLCAVIMIRAYFAYQDKNKMIFIGIFFSLNYFFLSGVLLYFLGVKGIAISYLFSWFILDIYLVFIIFVKHKRILYNFTNLRFILSLSFSALIIVVILKYYKAKVEFSNFTTFWGDIMTLVTGFSLGLIIYICLINLLISKRELFKLFKG